MVLTYVQSAYRKPAKQKTAMSIKKTNWLIMALRDNTIKLFFNVTKAKLESDELPVQQVLECTCTRDIPREKKACDKRQAIDTNSFCPSAS